MMRAACFLLVVASLAWATPARPCACSGEGVLETTPADGASDVPVNALVWSRAHELPPEKTRILDAISGEEVRGVWSSLWAGGQEIVVFHPERAWAPSATYEIVSYQHPPARLVDELGEAMLGHFEVRRSAFTTGTHALEEELGAPEVSYDVVVLPPSDPVRGSSCDPSPHPVTVTFSVAHDGFLLVAMRDSEGRLNQSDSRVSGVVGYAGVTGEVRFGTGSCAAPWRDAAPGESARFRFVAFDLAGRQSPWSERIEVTLPPAPSPEPVDEVEEAGPVLAEDATGCAQSRPSALPFALLAMTLAALRPRRRA